MSQKTENEETEFKVPETITTCVNNCGLTGNPTTNNMCQNCFTATTVTTVISPHSSRSVNGNGVVSCSRKRSYTEQRDDYHRIDETTTCEVKRVVNRCSSCRRKVGLTGFRCRCGDVFCGEHRYSDRHDCSYDYKGAGKEAIARENPVIRASKIVKV
ncbi:hypothetical protein Lal_00024299 [Lupinus albus]|uniref:Putative transcription regulator A20-like family n=1 Tax=Lupinus albus TaxID=3870 RepID=A0A6A5M5T3_LUPAL|nr:putative transcription regulator A20-like family [Lupinus albus]KAF1866295.1 hypothetical protein Lal_00024299 [Lupinus albus]